MTACSYALRLASSNKHQQLHSRPMISLQVFYEGNVQGVGFRWAVRHAAKGFDVTGWVRNLPDGRVELQATGEEDEVRGLLDCIAQGELHSLIHTQTDAKLEKPVSARGFEIRYD
jgi:acylphosphatase